MKGNRWMAILLLAATSFTLAGNDTLAQRRRPMRSTLPSSGMEFPLPPSPPVPTRRMMKASYEQLQKDTEKLYELAGELKEEVAKTNEDLLSVAGIKKAEEVEKLAKKIQSRIKNL